MANFGDILDDWDSLEKKKPLNPRTGSKSREPVKKIKTMRTDWLDLYPPEDKDTREGTPSAGHRNKKRIEPDKLPVEATIDLHGMTSREAVSVTENFLKNGVRKGFRKVLIIHGKGYHSPGGKSILKKEIRRLLERSPLVSVFGHGDRFHGGLGASWVVLNSKKNKA